MEWKKIDEEDPSGKFLYYLGWSEPYNSHAFIYWNKYEKCFWDEERDRKLRGYQYWIEIPRPPK